MWTKKTGALLALLLLAACGPNISNIGKQSDPTRFYTLTSTVDNAPENVSALADLTVGVGPVNVAEYLDRSDIVVRESSTRLDLPGFDRWAAAPKREIQRVVADNLSTLLGTEQMVLYPWKLGLELDVSVEIAVDRFERAENGEAVLVASWQLFEGGSREPVLFRRSVLSKPCGAGYEAIAQALSGLTGELSTVIAAAIRQQV